MYGMVLQFRIKEGFCNIGHPYETRIKTFDMKNCCKDYKRYIYIDVLGDCMQFEFKMSSWRISYLQQSPYSKWQLIHRFDMVEDFSCLHIACKHLFDL